MNMQKLETFLKSFFLFSLLASPFAQAATVTVSSNASWATGANAGADVVVTGAGTTLTLASGSYSFNSLIIQTSAIVLAQGNTGTSTGVTITIADYATINAGTSLHANFQGHGTASGSGAGTTSGVSAGGSGGSYGGVGGYGKSTTSPASIYGSANIPTNLGSGGGTSNTTLGGAGGGAIKLVVTNTFTLNGTISANGAAGNITSTTYAGGGGSGGSVWLSVGTFAGSGTITANGGASLTGGGANPSSGQGGGGSGGRIAIYYGAGDTTSLTSISNSGGQGFPTTGGSNFASSGTYFEQNTSTGDLTCARSIRGGYDPSNVPATTIRDVNISGGCTFVVENGILTASRNVTIGAGASMNADGMGYGSGAGSGAGTNAGATAGGGGGSYGGAGSIGKTTTAAGATYGIYYQPTDKGSGGGGSNSLATGGAGGGYIKLVAGGTVTVDGTLSSNGAKGYKVTTVYSGGSGSGGSLWIQAATFAGGGSITANGADSDAGSSGRGGGGGGGRIAVYFSSSSTFSGTNSTAGGIGYNATGGAGTFHKQNSSNGDFKCDSSTSSVRVIYDPSDIPTTAIRNIDLSNNCNLIMTSNGTLSVSGDVTIASGSAINLDGMGDIADTGTCAGVGAISSKAGGGAGHGSMGGVSKSGKAGGGQCGSATNPTTIGSGGGTGSLSTAPGGTGGGAIKLIVPGTLTLNGTITANGADGASISNYGGGGGAGGSVWLQVGTITGSTGILRANGGNGGPGGIADGGYGSGGRIALHYSTANTYTGSISVNSGTIYASGQTPEDGTYFEQNSSTEDVSCTRNIHSGVPDGTSVHNITVSGGCRFTIENGTLTASGDVSIAAGSSINANYLGTPSGPLNAGSCGTGGCGGNNSATSVQQTAPYTVGGNGEASSVNLGGTGGGKLKLVVAGTLTVDGILSADGNTGTYFGSTTSTGGGGAGGSLWMDVGTLAGSGAIHALGGSVIAAGTVNGTGIGGSGGAIALHRSVANNFSGTVAVTGGTSTHTNGSVGSIRGFNTATHLTYSQQPQIDLGSGVNGVSNVALFQQPIVEARDAGNIPDINWPTSITLTAYSDDTCTTLITGATVADSPKASIAGVTTFTGAAINLINGGNPIYLKASSGAATTACSSGTITLDPGSVSKLAFTRQSSSSNTAGTVFGTVPKVAAQDSGGNTIAGYASNISLSIFSDNTCSTPVVGGTLTASTAAPTSGVSTFTGVNYTLANTVAIPAYYFKSTSGLLTSACSSSFTVSATSAFQILFTTQPSAFATAGVAPIQQPAVSLADSYGNVVADFGTTIQLSPFLLAGCTSVANGGTLGGSSAVTANGVAVYSGLNYTKSGIIYLKATTGGLSTCSSFMDVSSGPAAKLAFTQQPSSTATPAVNFVTQPIVGVEDSYGNIVTTSSASVSLAPYLNNSCTNLASGILSQSESTTSGIATFSNVKYNTSETIYLQASSSGLTNACSSGVNLSSPASSVKMFFRGF